MAKSKRRSRRKSPSAERRKQSAKQDEVPTNQPKMGNAAHASQRATANETPVNQKTMVCRAMEAMKAFALRTNSMGIQGLRDAFSKLQRKGAYPKKLGDIPLTVKVQRKYPDKCRYSDIVCLDQTRVVLGPWPDTNCDFIHANWVTGPMLCNKFICTQGPLENTVGDFWRMVWQEHVELVIMLCRTVEARHSKCAQYWPKNVGESVKYAGITIKTEEVLKEDPDIVSTTLLIKYCNEKRRVYHHQWITWPDRFVPKQLIAPFSLLSIARMQKYPVIVHCSAGIGRTGTLVALEVLAQMLLSGREALVTDIIWAIRSQRAKVVQGDEQYLYIHYLILQRLVNKGIIPDTLARSFCRDYEHFYYARTHDVQVPLPVYLRRPVRIQMDVAMGGPGTASLPAPTFASATSDTQKAASAPLRRRHDKKHEVFPPAVKKVSEEKSAPPTKKDVPSADEPTPNFVTPDVMKSVTKIELDRKYQQAQEALLSQFKQAQEALKLVMEKAKRELEPIPVSNPPKPTPAAFSSRNVEQLFLETEEEAAAGKAGKQKIPASGEAEKEQAAVIAQAEAVSPAVELDDMEYIFMQPEYAGKYPKYTKDVIKKANLEMNVIEDDGGSDKVGTDEASVYAMGPRGTHDRALQEQYFFKKRC